MASKPEKKWDDLNFKQKEIAEKGQEAVIPGYDILQNSKSIVTAQRSIVWAPAGRKRVESQCDFFKVENNSICCLLLKIFTSCNVKMY